MSNHNLFTLSADGAVVPASSETILIAARQVLAHRVRRGASLQSPQKTGEYLTVRLGHLDYEVFGLILLDKRHRVIECIDLFRGTIDGAVHPREVVKLALQKSAAACIVCHSVARHRMRVMLPTSFCAPVAEGLDIVRIYFGVGHITVTVADATHSLSATKGWLSCWNITFPGLRRLIAFGLYGSERRSVGTQSGCQRDSSRVLRPYTRFRR
jgi:hypothetical protein